jgi:hypothetical protein
MTAKCPLAALPGLLAHCVRAKALRMVQGKSLLHFCPRKDCVIIQRAYLLVYERAFLRRRQKQLCLDVG